MRRLEPQRRHHDRAAAPAASGTDSTAAPASTAAAADPNLSGTISADGSSTVGPLTTAAAEAFGAANSGVQVTVGISGTGGGFEKFCNGETDMSDASRPIKDEEKAACDGEGHQVPSSSWSPTTASPSS